MRSFTTTLFFIHSWRCVMPIRASARESLSPGAARRTAAWKSFQAELPIGAPSIPAALDRRDGEGATTGPQSAGLGSCSLTPRRPTTCSAGWRTTMKYLMLIKHAESFRSQPIPQGLLDAIGEFVNEQIKSGVLKDTA